MDAITKAGPKFEFDADEVYNLYKEIIGVQLSYMEQQADEVAKV